MRKIFMVFIFLLIGFLMIRINFNILNKAERMTSPAHENHREISGTIKKGDTLFDIFKKCELDLGELFKLREATADIHKLRELSPDQPYKIIINDSSQINEFIYWIDDDTILNVTRTEWGFHAEKKAVEYEKRVQYIGGVIKDNLISSIGEGRENLMLALQLSDIFAWDIDFTSDLRNGDTFKIVTEEFYLDGEFRKYGNILSAEFINNGEAYRAYRFELNGKADYYDADGKSLRRAFLKAPLSFRSISSHFSKRRFHPILKIYRPHHGLDYTTPAGTPVSTIGDGKVIFAGYKGQYGKLLIIKHPNGYKTYYGHLSKIRKGMKRGVKVEQGQVIGYVGATGLATGLHLHYEMRVKNKPVNPFAVKLPRGNPVPKTLMAEFIKMRDKMTQRFASIRIPVSPHLEDNKKEG